MPTKIGPIITSIPFGILLVCCELVDGKVYCVCAHIVICCGLAAGVLFCSRILLWSSLEYVSLSTQNIDPPPPPRINAD